MENLNKKMLAAAQAGDLVTVEKTVADGADINYTDKWGNRAIFAAAWEGNVKALDSFYTLGANLTFETANLLCNAAYNGKIESVKWLLNKGADANFAFADTGENALHYTISKTSEMDIRSEIVRVLIDAGTDVNKKTVKGVSTICFMRDAFLKAETPLHRAAAYGNEKVINFLVDAGADKSAKDANGDTPLSWGSWHLRDNDILRLLIYDGVPDIG